MTNKPDWFCCKNCLLTKTKTIRICGHDEIEYYCTVKEKDVNEKYFCKEWVCNNCWESWDDWDFDEETETELKINHNQCKEVEFK